MLDSSEFKYEPYIDGRTAGNPEFTVGVSGQLLIATHKTTGKKYIVKHTNPHNAANEYVACWLAERMGAPAPKAYLLSPNRAFASKCAVAIEFLDGLRGFKKDEVPKELKADLMAQFALCLMLQLDDIIQLSRTDEHIYSYDFSEAFNMIDMKHYLRFDDDTIADFIRRPLQNFVSFTLNQDFNIPGLAREFNLDPYEMQKEMIAAVKRTAAITNDELDELSDELTKMYPITIAVYYEECIRAIRERAKQLD